MFLGFALTKPWLFYFGFNKKGNFGSSGGLLVENQKKLGNFGIRKPKQQRNFGFSAGFLVKNPKTPCVCFWWYSAGKPKHHGFGDTKP